MKKEWKWVFAAVAVMLGGPFLAVKLVPGDAGMAVSFLLFFAVNPVFSMAAGWSGRGCRWLPAVVAGLFLVGVWCFFDLGEPAFFFVRRDLSGTGLGGNGCKPVEPEKVRA